MEGRTRMGFEENGVRWIDCRFRSAFLLLTHSFGPIGLAVRGEGFETRNKGSLADADYDEGGWSAMIAAKREFGPAPALSNCCTYPAAARTVRMSASIHASRKPRSRRKCEFTGNHVRRAWRLPPPS